MEIALFQLQELTFAQRKCNHVTRGTAPLGSALAQSGFPMVC